MLMTLLKKQWCKDNLIFLKNYKEKAIKKFTGIHKGPISHYKTNNYKNFTKINKRIVSFKLKLKYSFLKEKQPHQFAFFR